MVRRVRKRGHWRDSGEWRFQGASKSTCCCHCTPEVQPLREATTTTIIDDIIPEQQARVGDDSTIQDAERDQLRRLDEGSAGQLDGVAVLNFQTLSAFPQPDDILVRRTSFGQ